MKKKFVALFLVMFFAVFLSNANALMVTYTDQSSWQANVTNIVTETFDTLDGNMYETLTLGPVTFDVPSRNGSNDLWVSTNGTYDGLGIALVGNYSPTSILATFDPATTAISADIFNLSIDDYITVSVVEDSVVNTYSVHVDNPLYSFFGVTTDTGYIQSIQFTPSASYIGIDNFSYGNSGTAPVPEPATIVLLGAGLLGLAGASRKKFMKK